MIHIRKHAASAAAFFSLPRLRGRGNGAAAAAAIIGFVALGFGIVPGANAQETPPPAAPVPSAPAPKLANRLDEIGPLMSRCLQMPPEYMARPGMRVTVRLSFTRDGEILGEPRFTFVTPGVPAEIRAAYQRAVVDMLDRCTPLPITKELGGAIAGRPFVFPIIETRKEKKAEL
jgi:hypothetical protein